MIINAFLQNFKLLADVPNSVPKLRELILQLAVQGKLVPQDQSDEPAERLLEVGEKRRKELIKAGLKGVPKVSADLPEDLYGIEPT